MLEGLRSPNIHTPQNLSEFSSIIQHYPTSSFWAGGTYIMSRKFSYPSNATNEEIIYLGSIEELRRFQRNDRVAEFGSMVSLYELITTGKTILPKILVDTIQSFGGNIATGRITIGGSLATRDFRSSLPGTLNLFDASCEVRYMKKKRMHSKWFSLMQIYDKSGRLNLPANALISRIRINLAEKSFQKFLVRGEFFPHSDNAVSLAVTGNLDQDNFNDARLSLTYPDYGFISNHDLDNTLSSARFPLDQSESRSVEEAILEIASATFPHLSQLQKIRTRGLVREMLNELNINALTTTSIEDTSSNI